MRCIFIPPARSQHKYNMVKIVLKVIKFLKTKK